MILQVLPNVGTSLTSTLPPNNITLTIDNCNQQNSYQKDLTQMDMENQPIAYYFTESQVCITFISPSGIEDANIAYWSIDFSLITAPSSNMIFMNESIKVVDSYFGNFSMITFKADHGTLIPSWSYKWMCSLSCSSGIFYLYDSDGLKNLYKINDGSRDDLYTSIASSNSWTVFYVGKAYNDKFLTGYIIARIKEDLKQNCLADDLVIPSKNTITFEFTANQGNCKAALYVPSNVNIKLTTMNYTSYFKF
uniref:CUB-like domain-containing protein n=1 Tax=Acrobeloides nanus TaxID=290746 RepID=A0A914CWM6_9BILA